MSRRTKMHEMLKQLALWLLLLCPTLSAAQQSAPNDTIHERLYRNFLELYRQGDDDEAFYEAAEALADYYKQSMGDLKRYYTMQLNICLYDTEHNQPYKAMRRANEMLEEMKVGHTDAYEKVYTALGTVFESRGNYRMASYYYKEALDHTDRADLTGQMSIQSRLAFLYMFTNTAKASHWNERYREASQDYPEYHQVYLFIRGCIDFAEGNREAFDRDYDEYRQYSLQHDLADHYGSETMELIRKVFDRQTAEVEALLAAKNHDLDEIGKLDMSIRAYEYLGQQQRALQASRQRAELVDSLNSDMLFNNLNEINAQAGLNRANAQASQAQQRTFYVVLVASVVLIGVLLVWLFMYRKTKKHLKEKNEQLHSALVMAEEGEKMKTEFVRSVSHEIRTPLNAISGFNDILNTPGITLSDEERSDLLSRIKDNVQAITNIVDDMLRVADRESNEFYPKSQTIYPNQFLSAMLYEHRDHVSASIVLNYTTRVINRFQIVTNEEGLRRVMEHLIQNAIKFTQRGHIEVHSELSADKRWLLVSVSDTGPGVPADKRSKIFEGFYKADAFQQGIGLGLTVSKKIAQKLGGDLVLDESYTDGARFVLSLPASTV